MGTPECLAEHYEFRNHVPRNPPSSAVITSADLIDDNLAAIRQGTRESLRSQVKTIDIARGSRFNGYLMSRATPIASDSPLAATVYANYGSKEVGLESIDQVFAAFVRIPDIHTGLLENPYFSDIIKTQEERDVYVQMHLLCIFDPKATHTEVPWSKEVGTDVIIEFVDNDGNHAVITDVGYKSALPLPPLLPSAAEQANPTPTSVLGDFDSLEGVDFNQACEESGLIEGTENHRVGTEFVHHTLTDIFPTAQLPYNAAEVEARGDPPPRITSAMCPRNLNGEGEKSHRGTDLSWGSGKEGDQILSPYNGEVMYTTKGQDKSESSAGHFIVIKHGEDSSGNRIYTRYLHLDGSSIAVNAGQQVSTGQLIGKVGPTSPGSTGPHLHYEIRVNMNEDIIFQPTGYAIPAFVLAPIRVEGTSDEVNMYIYEPGPPS